MSSDRGGNPRSGRGGRSGTTVSEGPSHAGVAPYRIRRTCGVSGCPPRRVHAVTRRPRSANGPGRVGSVDTKIIAGRGAAGDRSRTTRRGRRPVRRRRSRPDGDAGNARGGRDGRGDRNGCAEARRPSGARAVAVSAHPRRGCRRTHECSPRTRTTHAAPPCTARVAGGDPAGSGRGEHDREPPGRAAGRGPGPSARVGPRGPGPTRRTSGRGRPDCGALGARRFRASRGWGGGSGQETRPRRNPCATAWARSRTPSLRNSRRACVFTVSSDR